MKKVRLVEIGEGSIIAETLYDSNGNVLLSKGSKITKSIKNKLISMKQTHIAICGNIDDYDIERDIKPKLRIELERYFKSFTDWSQNLEKEEKIKQIVSEVTETVISDRDIMVEVLSLKSVGGYIYEHSVGVMILSLLLGTTVGLRKSELILLGMAAFLHDIGMVFVLDSMDNLKEELMLKEELEPHEIEIIKEHCIKGYEVLRDSTRIDERVKDIIIQHHERFDGSGYPHGLRGSETSLQSQIICIVDTYEALINKRPYREAFRIEEAMEFIMGNGGSLFNATLSKILPKMINPYPVDTVVQLNTNEVATVVKVNNQFFNRPVIKMNYGERINQEIDLMENMSIVITN